MQSKFKFETKTFALHCSFGVINVANFTCIGHDGTQIVCHQKQKKSNDQRALVIRYEKIKALLSLDMENYLGLDGFYLFLNYTITYSYLVACYLIYDLFGKVEPILDEA